MNALARDKAVHLDFWSSPVEPEPLGGGITNTNFNRRRPRRALRCQDRPTTIPDSWSYAI